MPLSLVMRYRSGTTRRPARAWVATFNLAALGFSAGCLLLGSALSSVWVPWAFTYTLAGFAAGCVLGGLGLWLSRWEATSGSLHYTPNTGAGADGAYRVAGRVRRLASVACLAHDAGRRIMARRLRRRGISLCRRACCRLLPRVLVWHTASRS
jgi:hypothetical protein